MSNLRVTHLFLQNSSFHCPQSVHNVSKCPFCTWGRFFCLGATGLYMLCEIYGCKVKFSWLLQLCRHQDILEKTTWMIINWFSISFDKSSMVCRKLNSNLNKFTGQQITLTSSLKMSDLLVKKTGWTCMLNTAALLTFIQISHFIMICRFLSRLVFQISYLFLRVWKR